MREALALRFAECCNAEFMRFEIREFESWDSGKRLADRLIADSNWFCLRRHPIHMQQLASHRLSANSPHVFVSTPRSARPGVHKLVPDCAGPTDELVDEAVASNSPPDLGRVLSGVIDVRWSGIFASARVPYHLFGSRGIGVSSGVTLFRICSFV